MHFWCYFVRMKIAWRMYVKCICFYFKHQQTYSDILTSFLCQFESAEDESYKDKNNWSNRNYLYFIWNSENENYHGIWNIISEKLSVMPGYYFSDKYFIFPFHRSVLLLFSLLAHISHLHLLCSVLCTVHNPNGTLHSCSSAIEATTNF